MSAASPRDAAEALELFLAARARGEPVDPARFVAEHAALGPELPAALRALGVLDQVATTWATSSPAVIERVGAFRIVREIGRGGMGVVLEAIEEPLGRRVALKVLPQQLVSSPSARARFRREAELAARLDHSGIAAVYGAGVEADSPWIAMRYVEGEPLSRLIASAREAGHSCVRIAPRTPGAREAALSLSACLAKAARALQAAHAQGVLHRDVKPSNIILAADGAPTLVDFGLAIAEDSSGHTLTHTGETAGTPAYMAPELVSGELSRSDAQCDVYSLGVTLYEALCTSRPFDGATPFALQRAILSGAPSDLRARNRGVPNDLAVVVATAMERDRSRRYRDAAALADDLEAVVAGRPIRARSVSFLGRVARWSRREPKQALLAGLFLVASLVAAVVGGAWWNGRGTVQAAEKTNRTQRLADDLEHGYNELSVNWLPEAEAHFQDALSLRPDHAEAVAGLAFVALKRHQASRIPEITANVHSPAFDALRALARGATPDIELGTEWFANAKGNELFIDGMRLMEQARVAAPAARRKLKALAYSRFNEAVMRADAVRMYWHEQRAKAAAELGDEAAIRSAAASIFVLWPDNERSCFTAARALRRVDKQAAIAMYQRAIRIDPHWSAPRQNLGQLYVEQERYDEAETELLPAVECNARDADAWNSLGIAYDHLECRVDARAALERAIALRPETWQSWANLSEMDLADKDPSPAADLHFQVALGFVPDEALLRKMRARHLVLTGRARDGLAEYATVVGLDAKDAQVWSEIAELLHADGRDADALAAIDLAIELAPDVKAHRSLRARIAPAPSAR